MRQKQEKNNPYRQVAIYTSAIFILPAGLLGGYYFGYLVDEYFGISPWGMIIGLILGGIGGFMQLFQLLSRNR